MQHSHSPENLVAEVLKRDPEFEMHLGALGLDSVDEYVSWCTDHGFSTRITKHWRERCKERFLAQQDAIRDRLSQKKQEKRQPRRIIERIFDGDLEAPNLTQPHLVLIQRAATTIEEQRARDAFQELLLCVEGRTGLLTTRPARPQLGVRDSNTFINGLLSLAKIHNHWIRPINRWRPRSHNVQRQFSSLAHHLLAEYPVPRFMDSAWFQHDSDGAARQQAWYRLLAGGKSPRSLDLPIPLTKRMVRHFLDAPEDSCIDSALRWSQVIGLGGNGRLAKAVLGSRIATDFENNDFWETVIRWFILNPMLDPVTGPLIDYIYRRKFEPTESDNNADQSANLPGCSSFSMKGRTPASLIRQMREWHAQLRKEPAKAQLEWPASGIGPFDWTEGNLALGNVRRWTIIELRSRRELHHEGQVLRHCVASYDNSCARGGTSIWSMGVERDLGRRKRALTIELANASRRICQIRGKSNRLPAQKEMNIVHRWAAQESLTVRSF